MVEMTSAKQQVGYLAARIDDRRRVMLLRVDCGVTEPVGSTVARRERRNCAETSAVHAQLVTSA